MEREGLDQGQPAVHILGVPLPAGAHHARLLAAQAPRTQHLQGEQQAEKRKQDGHGIPWKRTRAVRGYRDGVFARTYETAVRQQLALRERAILRGGPRRVRLVAGADISYDRGSDRFHAGVVLLSYPGLDIVEERGVTGRSPFPYIPGLLSFREGPLLLRVFRKLRGRPDLVLFDGHGLAHPRRFGVACHLGVLLDTPAIGCAKTRLVGVHEEPGPEPGDWVALRHKGRRIGAVLRTRKGVKPIFVSPGHRIGLLASVRWALRLGAGYRIPEPVRQAHLLANRLRRQGTGTDSSKLPGGIARCGRRGA